MKMSENGVDLRLLKKVARNLAKKRDCMIDVLKTKPRRAAVSVGDSEVEDRLAQRDQGKEKRRRNAEKDKEKRARSKGNRGKQKVHTRPRPRRPQVHRPAIHK